MNKRIKIIVLISLILIIALIFFIFRNKKKPVNQKSDQVAPTESIIPTVDSSVIVKLVPVIPGKELKLSIENIPVNTTGIEYSLTYDTKQQNAQGVIGSVSLDSKSNKYEKQITLGTCSSGRCVYHEVSGEVKLSLKFTGDYGDKIFEKDFSIN